MSRVLKFLKLLWKRARPFMVGAVCCWPVYWRGKLGLAFGTRPHDSARQIISRAANRWTCNPRACRIRGFAKRAGFSVYSRFAGPVQAGEFDLPPRANMRDISRILRLGDVVMHAITVPEGLTSQQVVELLFNEPVLSGEASIPAEGSLLPETYYVPRGHARTALLTKMQAAQAQALAQLWENRQPSLPLQTPQEAVLAQLSKRKPVRPANAGRWPRYLSTACASACDCSRTRRLFTVWWARSLGRPIRLSEIGKPTPYNTYTIFGCPRPPSPTPDVRRWPPCLTRPAHRRCILSPTARAGILPTHWPSIIKMCGAGANCRNSFANNSPY